MKCKKVRQMMVDIENHHSGDLGCAWLAWVDGVCLIAGANFLWVNHDSLVSINKDGGVCMEKCKHCGKLIPYWTVECPHCKGVNGHNR